MSQDDQFRAPLYYEMRLPLPPATHYTPDTRILQARFQVQVASSASPLLQVIHPTDARMPEECVLILQHTFQTGEFRVPYHMPGFIAWRDEQREVDPQFDVPMYEFHRQFLQVLQYQYQQQQQHQQSKTSKPLNDQTLSAGAPPKSWLLKSPAHLESLDAVHQVYPDSLMIWTHRDPLSFLPSLCFFMENTRCIVYDKFDKKAIGKECLEFAKNAIERGMRARDQLSKQGTPLHIVDVKYSDLVKDPILCVEKVYAEYGTKLSDQTKQRMQNYLRMNPQHKHGTNAYTLEEYGLDADAVKEEFNEYYKRYLL